jgi:hypothetical protein
LFQGDGHHCRVAPMGTSKSVDLPSATAHCSYFDTSNPFESKSHASKHRAIPAPFHNHVAASRGHPD